MPDNLTIVMGEATLSPDTDYHYDGETGTLTIDNVSASIAIGASSVIVPVVYGVTANVSNLELNGDSTVPQDKSWNGVLEADEGYELPPSIQIKMGTEELSEEVYHYDPQTGEISLDQVRGDILITAAGLPQVVQYAIGIEEGISGGHIIPGKEKAVAGERIVLTIQGEEGMRLVAGSLKVIGQSGTEVEVNEDKSFMMPEEDVRISGAFEPVGIIGDKGDLDGNGKVTVYDALLTLQIAVGKREGSVQERQLADVNGDGHVTAEDALQILRYAIGAIDSL